MSFFTDFIKKLGRSRKNMRSAWMESDDRQLFKAKHSCPSCKEHMDIKELIALLYVCPKCQYHFRLTANERLKMLFDSDQTMENLFTDISSQNPIQFPGYEEKLRRETEKSGLSEAVSIAVGLIEGKRIVIAAMSFQFMGGSMGSVVGEKITRAVLYAVEEKIPCLICTASGGARMQEGIFSLLQMAKTSHAITLLRNHLLPLFILVCDPTTGGVAASFAMLGDVILAEPGALIGFAGPRVIEGTIKQKLPPDFQRAEFLLNHGFLDMIVARSKLRSVLSSLIDAYLFRLKKPTIPIEYKEEKKHKQITSVKKDRSAWEIVQLARQAERPSTLEYIMLMSDSFIELHGDRLYGDDAAMVCGVCKIANVWFTFIGQQKGKNMKESIQRNYGMAHPEGYRKAMRVARQAERFGRPILTLIDTPGAYPGIASEERGISESIAQSILTFSTLRTPIISVIIGEGGSGGALGIGVSDYLYMLENAVYSVITAEGFASILLRDSNKVADAAKLMKMTSQDLLQFGLIDGIIAEPNEGAHADKRTVAQRLRSVILETYSTLSRKKIDKLLHERSEKILSYGVFKEGEKQEGRLRKFLRFTRF